jgi:hypothetical protein
MVGSVVMPDRGETQMHSAHFTRTVNVNAGDISNGGFKVIMKPDLFMPGFITSSTNIIPSAALGEVFLSARVPINATVVESSLSTCTVTNSDKSEQLIFPIYELFADPTKQGIRIVVDPLDPPTYNITAQNTGTKIARISVTEYDAGGAVIVAYPFQLASSTVTKNDIAMAANCVAIGISAPLNVNNGQGVLVTALLSKGQVLSGPTQSFAPAFSQQIIDDNIISGRVISMSALCHNTSPAIFQGGVVNTARAPYNMSPFTVGNVSVQNSISKLPANRRFQDSAQDGTYAFWVPGTTAEWDVGYIANLADTYSKSDYVLADFSSLPVGSSFMIQFDWIVEFNVQNQLFPVESTPPLMPVVEEYRQALLRLDAAMSNSAHIDSIRSFVSSIKNKGNQLYEHFEQNKAFYNVILSALTTLGSLA